MKTKMFFSVAIIVMASLQAKSQIITNSSANYSSSTSNQSGKESITSGYLTLNGGVSLPVGEYEGYAFAKTGYTFNLSGAYPIANSNFGVAGKILYSTNTVNTVQENLQSGGFFSGGNFSEESAMAGLFITVPYQKFSFDFTALAGLMMFTVGSSSYFNFYDYSYGTYYYYDEYSSTNTVSNSSALVLNGRIEIRYNITKHLCIVVGGDFLYSNQPVNSTQTGTYTDYNGFTNTTTTTPYSYPNSYKQPVETINVNAGFGVTF